ncbi:hypothetical protein [Algoriphagus sp. PAP.12]|uniref:hypothetical protein n=1 Tax=Algoriphagus sp. PAP.12 TaxID=2996678 RepID=UPI00227C9C59|nr:hypothetical protein [Algoriphagus sp. PAP.12]
MKNNLVSLRLFYFLGCIFLLGACKEDEKPSPIPEGHGRISISEIQLTNSDKNFPESFEDEITISLTNQSTSETNELTIHPNESPIQEFIVLPFETYLYSFQSANSSEFSKEAQITLGGTFTLSNREQTVNLVGTRNNSRIVINSNKKIGLPSLQAPSSVEFSNSNSKLFQLYTNNTGQIEIEVPYSSSKSFSFFDQLELGSEKTYQVELDASDNDYEVNTIKIDPEGNLLTLVGLEKSNLESSQNETSGLAWIEGRLFSINDGDNTNQVHELDPNTGKVLRSITIENSQNRDWEELAQSDTHLFIGDFGNNLGYRKDLAVYKVSISDLLTKTSVTGEKLNFIYPDQIDFTSREDHRFDCEAMVFSNNQLHIFTKIPSTLDSDHYTLEINQENQNANFIESVQTDCMVTGAEIDSESGQILLLGIKPQGTKPYEQFLSLFGSIQGNGKLSSRTQFIKIGYLTIRGNTEGISLGENKQLLISSEQFSYSGFPEIPPKLSLFSLNGIL